FRIFNAPFTPATKALHNLAFALPHHHHIHINWTSLDSVVGTPVCQIGHTGASNHCLRRCTAFINAGSTHMLTLYKCRLPTCPCQCDREWTSSLTCPNNNCVIGCCLRHGF